MLETAPEPVVAPVGGVTEKTTRTEQSGSAAGQSIQQASHDQQEQTRRTGSQLHTNLLWEATQATIAISITWSILYVCVTLAIRPDQEASRSALLLLNASFVMVVSLYLQRTNHTKVSTAGEGTSQR